MTGLLDEVLVRLAELVAFPTVTDRSNLDLVEYAEALLVRAGAATVRTADATGAKANLLATIGPPVDGGVVLSGHTDVVPEGEEGWTTPPFTATRRADRIHGRGTADMKGFVACVLAMAPRFAAADLARPVHVALTFDEEVGCQGAPLLIDALVRTGPRPMAAIVGEPTSMGVVAAHKGCYEYTTTIAGLEGHGSAPDRGVNAVEVAARYVGELLGLRDELAGSAGESPFDPPGTTINVGTIRGGSARNVIAGECTLEWELRPVHRSDAELVTTRMADLERAWTAELRARHPDAAIETTTVGAVDGLELDPTSPAVSLAARLTGATGVEVASFGTEAGLYQQAGIPAVVCGPGSIEVAHRPDEHVTIGQLQRCVAALERLVAVLREPAPAP